MSILTTIFGFVSNIIQPVADMVDDLNTSDEEKLELKNKLVELENAMQMKVIEYETKLMDSQASIIKSEATGKSWLQRNWRPLMMVFFAIMLGMYWFGYKPEYLSEEALSNLFDLIKIGIGGYVIGRSAEKIVPQILNRSKDNG